MLRWNQEVKVLFLPEFAGDLLSLLKNLLPVSWNLPSRTIFGPSLCLLQFPVLKMLLEIGIYLLHFSHLFFFLLKE